MTKKFTAGDLFAVAITFERDAEAFYRGLANKFSKYPEVSSFWISMMEDEVQHAKGLERICESLTKDQLQSPCDFSAISGKKFAGSCNLDKISNLDEACEAAHDIESSEMNAQIHSLTKRFIPPEMRVDFILLVLENHVSRLREFSESFSAEEKRKINAVG